MTRFMCTVLRPPKIAEVERKNLTRCKEDDPICYCVTNLCNGGESLGIPLKLAKQQAEQKLDPKKLIALDPPLPASDLVAVMVASSCWPSIILVMTSAVCLTAVNYGIS